jgi:hypothetical protein
MIRRGASAASFIERIIGSWWKLVFSATVQFFSRLASEDSAGKEGRPDDRSLRGACTTYEGLPHWSDVVLLKPVMFPVVGSNVAS